MQTLHTDHAPAAIGPYSHGVVAGDFVFISGQLPLRDGVLESDPGRATSLVLAHIEAILREAGADRNALVKLTLYLADMETFTQVNDAYAAFFGAHRPARAVLEAAALPKGAIIEADAIAHII